MDVILKTSSWAQAKIHKERPEMKPEITITEPAAVAALRGFYLNNGPGLLGWDFSIPGRVRARDGRLEAENGALTCLNLCLGGLRGVLKIHNVESLTTLKANRNSFRKVALKNLPALGYIDLENNLISDLSFVGLSGLAKLNLWHNVITILSPLIGVAALTKLWLGFNKIRDLSPLAGLTGLT